MDDIRNERFFQAANKKLDNRKIKIFTLVIIVAVIFYLGRVSARWGVEENLPIVVTELKSNPPSRYQEVNFSLFWEVWDKLKSTHLQQSIEDSTLFYGALKGAVASLGDPYTVFFDPKDAKEFKNELSGQFDGIGAELGFRNKAITIIAPLAGTPAERAGLRAGDIILEVNKKDVTALSLDEVVRKIRGPKKTSVILTIFRQGEVKSREITVMRETIVVPPVTLAWQEVSGQGQVPVIKLSTFQADTPQEFSKYLRAALVKNPKFLIVDLRNNPGGYLEAAVAVASHWLESGPVVKESFRDHETQEDVIPGILPRVTVPTYVLINKGSASASEILAGALQDGDRAVLVGEISFGKGSVQDFENLPDGSAIKITIAKWLTPKGRQINETGITPNIVVPMTSEDYDKNKDPQMDRVLQEIGKL